jgi:hypothetical protein
VFGLGAPKLPISSEHQAWVDESFRRLAGLLGARRLLDAIVVLPTEEHFPDPYDRSEAALRNMFHRVAKLMQVDPTKIELSVFAREHDMTRSLVPFFRGKDSGASGLYLDEAEKPHISVDEALLKEPATLVGVLAHEIGHVILLRPGLIQRDDPDMEPLTDLVTVFLGFGIFPANSAFYFEQHTHYDSQGWSARRLGYLPEEVYGYALARFAYERGESKPRWASFLSTNVAAYLKRSASWLSRRNEPHLF